MATEPADRELRRHMAKKSKKKQTAVPYEFIQEVNKMSKYQIVIMPLRQA
jgi:hypothetical protein